LGSCTDQTGQHPSKIEATIETILILTQVPVSVLFKVERMVSSTDGSLEVAKDRVDPGEAFHAGALSTGADNLTLLIATGIGN